MKIKVKPKEGLKIVMPDLNRELPVEGAVVESSTYWHRRLAEGDVVLMEEIKEQPLESAKAGKSKNEGGLK
jgi:hypothetical protein